MAKIDYFEMHKPELKALAKAGNTWAAHELRRRRLNKQAGVRMPAAHERTAKPAAKAEALVMLADLAQVGDAARARTQHHALPADAVFAADGAIEFAR